MMCIVSNLIERHQLVYEVLISLGLTVDDASIEFLKWDMLITKDSQENIILFHFILSHLLLIMGSAPSLDYYFYQ